MYSFLKAFLVLMKLLSLSQFYAPKFCHKITIKHPPSISIENVME